VWLLLSLGMLVLWPVHQHGLLATLAPGSEAAGLGFSHAYYGAARHAITVGFVSLMIVGVAAKVVPTLNGVPSRRLSPLWGPFVLVNLGCALRVFGQTLTDFTTGAFPVAGVSGLLEVTGLALWGGHLWLVMSGRPRLRDESPAGTAKPAGTLAEDEPVRGDHAVGTVLDSRPELLDVFVAHGFTMLTSPQFRRTMARVVTVEQACRRTGIEPREFVHVLNERQHGGHCCPQCSHEQKPSAAGEPPVKASHS
jgi:hypothetical protein